VLQVEHIARADASEGVRQSALGILGNAVAGYPRVLQTLHSARAEDPSRDVRRLAALILARSDAHL
jgi:hypothetical protein